MMQRSQKFELYLCNCVPGLLTLFLALCCLVPKHVEGLASYMPLLTLPPIFYWGIRHANEMPFWFVFVLGLIMDAVMGQPLGFTSLLYIFFLITLYAQRKYIHKEGFIIKWGYFGLLLALYQFAGWALLSIIAGHSMPMGSAFAQWVLTVFFYPLLHKAFETIESMIGKARWHIASRN